MFKKIVIQNVGVLRAFNAGTSPELSQLSLFYARNGRGKSTLTAVLRAARNGSSSTILARRSLGNNAAAPHITLVSDGGNRLFKDGAWQHERAPIEVFDAEFIADNVFAGEMTTLEHDRGLFAIIVGEEGVRLNRLLERFKEYAKKAKTALDNAEEALADDEALLLSAREAFMDADYVDVIDGELQEATWEEALHRYVRDTQGTRWLHDRTPLLTIAVCGSSLPGTTAPRRSTARTRCGG